MAGDFFHADFSFGGGAGGEVEDEWGFAQRRSDRERIGREARCFAAGGRNADGTAVGVHHEHRNEAGRCGLLAVFAEPADVAAVHHGSQAEPPCPGLLGQLFDHSLRLHLADAPVRIGHDARRAVVQDGEFRPRHDLAILDRLHVVRHAHHAMRVVALQIRIDEAGSDEFGVSGRAAAGLEQLGGEGFEGSGFGVGRGEVGQGEEGLGLRTFVLSTQYVVMGLTVVCRLSLRESRPIGNNTRSATRSLALRLRGLRWTSSSVGRRGFLVRD